MPGDAREHAGVSADRRPCRKSWLCVSKPLNFQPLTLSFPVSQGKKNVEVRPAHTNKGEIVRRLLYQHPDAEFCMCAGDDKTDEDMFHSMARIFSNSTPGGGPTLVHPPASFSTFPSLARAVKEEDDEGALPEDLSQPVESHLDPSATFMIAIEALETAGAKMTMANAVLER